MFFFDPALTPFYPQCAFHRLTGLNCPGCGATRGLYALLHGRWRQALQDNLGPVVGALQKSVAQDMNPAGADTGGSGELPIRVPDVGQQAAQPGGATP